MKKLVFGALIALAASQAGGCIITSDNTGNDGFITASWNLKSVATGTSATCPPGYDTAALYSQPVDSLGNNAGSVVIDLFNCDAGTGQSAPLIPGLYDSWIAITNHDNSAQYATSTKALVDIAVADKSFTAAILVDGGYFSLAWNLTRASNGAPLLCADVAGIGGVETISTSVSNSQNSADDIYPCEDHQGITGGFLAGTYTVSVDAIDSNHPPGAISNPINFANKVITSPNIVTPLGTVTIPITNL
jgi:hypothetical protein